VSRDEIIAIVEQAVRERGDPPQPDPDEKGRSAAGTPSGRSAKGASLSIAEAASDFHVGEVPS